MPWCPSLQKKNYPHETAKGVTQEEFCGFMRRAVAAFWKQLTKPRDPDDDEDKGNMARWVGALGRVPRGEEERGKFVPEGTPSPPGGWARLWFPVWSFDNPSIHGGTGGKQLEAVLSRIGLPAAEVFDLPVHSSDMHKVVEHTHSRIVDAFEDWFYSNPKPYPLAAYKEVIKLLFYDDPGVAAPNVIEGDVCTLPLTLEAIAAVEGREIPKRLR